MLERLGDKTPRIHPTAWVHPSAVIIGDVELGARVNVWPHVTIRADEGSVVIGEDTNVQDGTTIHMTGGLSEVKIGKRVTIGHNCILHGCTIEDDILIGMGSLIMDNATVESGAFVGAGTLVTGQKRVPADTYVMGNPMRVVRANGEREKTWIAYAWSHYVENAKRYQEHSVAISRDEATPPLK